MKVFKKLIAAVGMAAAALSAPASAIQLLLFDGADHLLYAASSGASNQVSVNGRINGWQLQITGGAVDYGNPYVLSISGNMFRASASTTTGGLGLNSNTLISLFPDSTVNFSNASTGGTAPGLKPFATSLTNLTSTATTAAASQTLKLRIADYDFGTRFPSGDLVGLQNNLFISSFPTNGSKTSMQVDYTNGASTNIGQNSYNGTAGLNRTETSYFTQNNGTLIAGFDLFAPGLQNSGNGFNLSNTVTSVPEPGTLALLGLSLVGIAALRRKQAA